MRGAGQKAGDATVTDIRGLLYDKGTVSYKLRHGHEWSLLARCPTRRQSSVAVEPLYSMPLQITGDKYKHLQDLKAMIPGQYHEFYDSLSHS